MHNLKNLFFNKKFPKKARSYKKNLVYGTFYKSLYFLVISEIKCKLAKQRPWGGDWFTLFMQDLKQDPDPGLDPKQSEKLDPDSKNIILDPQHW
jgi:hypothetical protein